MKGKILTALLAASVVILASCDKKAAIPVEMENTEENSTSSGVMNVSPSVELLLSKVGVEEESQETVLSLGLDEKQKGYVTKASSFAFDLLSSLYDGTSIAMSPLGLEYVLGMLQEASDGNTSSQIRYLMGMPEEDREYVNTLLNAILERSPRLDGTTKVSLSNAGIIDTHYEIDPLFDANAVKYYKAVVQNMDFSDAKKVTETINGWSNGHTNGLIPKLIDDETSLEDKVGIIMNALYFKGVWREKFYKENNTEDLFYGPDEKNTLKTFMHAKRTWDYYAGEKFRSVSLPLGIEKNHYSMTFVLPEEGVGLTELAGLLSNGGWSALVQGEKSQDVEISLPKFITESGTLQFKEILSGKGMTDAFSVKADFSRLLKDQNKNLRISEIFQKTKLGIDESGVEAASLTATSMAGMNAGVEPNYVEIVFDRPFCYAISDKESGLILFVGAYSGD